MHTLLIIAALAMGQAPVGNFLPRPEYQTYATKTYYVQPDGGSDSNDCTSLLTQCKTPHAVVARWPRFLRHNIAVNVAAGGDTFTTPLSLDGLEMAPGVSVTFKGDTNWSTVTPPSGSATGTLTGVTAISFPNKYILTDSSQSWPAFGRTANSLAMRGRFVCFTSGAAVGGKYPIVGHSATTLELATAPSPAPSAGTTYTLCTPSTTWTVAPSVGQVARVRNGNGLVVFNDIAFLGTGPNTVSVGGLLRLANNDTPTVKSTLINVTVARGYFFSQNDFVPLVEGVGVGTLAINNSSLAGQTQTSAGTSGSNSTISYGSSTNANGDSRLTLTGVYLRCQRNIATINNTALGLSGVFFDTEQINATSAVHLISCTATVANTWVYNSYPNQTNLSGIVARNGTTISLTGNMSIDGFLTGLDFASLDGQSRFRSFGGALFSGTATAGTAQLRISNSSLPTAAGVKLDTGNVINWNGTYTATGIADGGRAWVCPDGTTAYTDAQVTGAAGSIVQCGGATIQR